MTPTPSIPTPTPPTVHPLASPASGDHTPDLEQVNIDGEPFFVIRDVSAMPPFLMSIVSDTDFWLFVGSNGSFTAGRTDPDHAIFPYQTADKILACPESAGALAIFQVETNGGSTYWEPWRGDCQAGSVRNLYKHAAGTSVIFEEIRSDLGLRFRWTLEISERYGLVRRCALANLSDEHQFVRYLDGFHHLMPSGVTEALYSRYSYLACAYMRHERSGSLGIFTLNSKVSDRAEPGESLHAACAWSLGHQDPTFLLSDRQVGAFRTGEAIAQEDDVRGEFGAWLVADAVGINGGAEHRWACVADTGLDHAKVIALAQEVSQPSSLEARLKNSLNDGIANLRARVAAADGLQQTSDHALDAHHFANTTFNCMRGGVPDDGYEFPTSDFAAFLRTRNRGVAARNKAWLELLPPRLDLHALHKLATESGDVQLTRLAREYLPLLFSRRHGDPSRPWNFFSIQPRDANGCPAFGYQGNWRDIFQNWESLAQSYPDFLASMVAVFLNSSTADGYNPYRITRDGFEWEILDPEDPWSQIGYWGDHQIVYLSRLLESLEAHEPGRQASGLADRLYTHAVLPYRICDLDDLLRDPRHSITFDFDLHRDLLARAEAVGNDGKLLTSDDNEPALFSLAEKLLVPVLAKLGNFVPGGGIWLNTQRPEWNDGNNALAGWGLSVVTVFHLRRHLVLLEKIFVAGPERIPLSSPVRKFLRDLATVFDACPTDAGCMCEDDQRLALIRRLGAAGEQYRHEVYTRVVPEAAEIPASEIREFLKTALAVLESTLSANIRPDGLVHSYNLLSLTDSGARVSRLALMLEGQAAALGSGFLQPAAAVRLLNALRASALYRADQHSYLLQPDRELASFFKRNLLPEGFLEQSALGRRLLSEGDRSLLIPDCCGGLHFHPDFANVSDLERRLDELVIAPEWTDEITSGRALFLQAWEDVFHHSAFTGRSGAIFGFEGLGSIYWHMVAKLLLAVQECHAACEEEFFRDDLALAYQDIREGLGFRKTPEAYGAFPTDPYSHTPGHRGAQQPGMTGQVKEEILIRFGELGVEVRNGMLGLHPTLLDPSEFSTEESTFRYRDIAGTGRDLRLAPGSIAFTYCQVPIIFRSGDAPRIQVARADGLDEEIPGTRLPEKISRAIFSRTGLVTGLTVIIAPE